MRSKQHTMAMKTNKKGNREKVLFFCFFNTKQQRWHTTTPNERSAADWSKLGSSVSFRQRERELYQRRRGRAYAVPLLLPAAVSIRARWRSGSFFPLCFQSGGRREGRNTWGQRTVEETRGQQFLSICISRFFFFCLSRNVLGRKRKSNKTTEHRLWNNLLVTSGNPDWISTRSQRNNIPSVQPTERRRWGGTVKNWILTTLKVDRWYARSIRKHFHRRTKAIGFEKWNKILKKSEENWKKEKPTHNVFFLFFFLEGRKKEKINKTTLY